MPSKAGFGSFCWTELMTRDVAAARRFYGELVGWKTTERDIGPLKYTMFTPPGATEPIGGMMQMDDPEFAGIPPHWLSYILVENVDATTQRAVQLGGTIKVPPEDVPDIGRFSIIQDPTGAVIALFQSRM